MIKSGLNRLVSSSLVYGISGTLQRFISFFLLPLYTRVLTPEDYGVIALLGISSKAVGGILTSGTGNSLGVLLW
jgi:O-antigen/teichoic acid export membrane protein